ncbi:TPA: hypothetical protein N2N62_002459 [Citrobacter freundii]|uniref:Ead/Ea22-like family protein n=1 Tax=Citrobacter freundii TaxID=546 RepID=A0AAN4D0U8_CITFR|nr:MULTISPECIES: hypothetical protein [Citrobacter freundii complex]ASG44040.1 hypothetical protein CES93_10540 [Citrobacter freundii]EKV1032032.1 hypothetical protein [Citrobacter freundii]EKV4649390.1 hypothetical protein [Citrobacter freundii]EKW5567445.1 hypothetical protein [Citrobacter freundii]EKW7209829.1 hypothetical protein [Citrobacter freundii]
MTALNKQALIAKIKKQTESFDTVVLKEDEANALLGELESQQTFQQAFFRQSLMYDVVAEAYEEAKEQIAKDVEIKARLCLESNSLFDRLRAAEKRIAEHNFENRLLANADRDIKALRQRIAELEARTVTLPPTFWYEHDDLSRDIPVLDKRLVKKAIRAAGIGVKGE